MPTAETAIFPDFLRSVFEEKARTNAPDDNSRGDVTEIHGTNKRIIRSRFIKISY